MSLNVDPVNEKKEKFIDLLKSTNREGMDNLLAWLEKTDFYIAPSSTMFHGNYKGGLLDHSLNVYEVAKRIYSDLHELNNNIVIPEESIIIATLLHDICKVNQYVIKQKWRKDKNDKWEQYDTYVVEDKFPFGHGEKSAFMLANIIKLKASEALAIRWHMGSFECANTISSPTKFSFSTANENYPLVSILQAADFLSSMNLETKAES